MPRPDGRVRLASSPATCIRWRDRRASGGHRDYAIRTLRGLGAGGRQDDTQVMIPMGAQQTDCAGVVHRTVGNAAPFIEASDVARVRTAAGRQPRPMTVEQILTSLPVLLQAQPAWKVTASHNPAAAANALTLAGWNSAESQKPGMYVQVELPEPAMIAEVQFTAAGGGRLGGGGASTSAQFQPAGRAAGGAGAAAAPAPAGGGRATIAPGPPVLGIPRQYQVQVSLDGQRWTPVATGAGSALTAAPFAPVRAKFVRVTQTGTAADAPAWVVQNLRLYSAPAPAR